MDFFEEIEVYASASSLLDRLFAATVAQVDGLIATDIELMTPQVWMELGNEVPDQFDALGILGAQALWFFAKAPVGGAAVGGFRKFAVRLMDEPAGHVAKAVLVGDEFDEAFVAIVIDDFQVPGGEWAGVFPDGFVSGVSEGVLGVELKLVDLKAREFIDGREQGFHAWHLAAGNIEHEAPVGEVGMVFYGEAWKVFGVKADDLVEALKAVEPTYGLSGFDADAFRGNLEPVGLFGHGARKGC